MKEKIGFIGLGIMGRHMSAHLLEAGYEVAVFDIVKSAVDEIAAQGAKACGFLQGSCPGERRGYFHGA